MNASTLGLNPITVNTVERGSLPSKRKTFMKEHIRVKNLFSVNFVQDDSKLRQSAESMLKVRADVPTVADI